jgi:hypothetical protein
LDGWRGPGRARTPARQTKVWRCPCATRQGREEPRAGAPSRQRLPDVTELAHACHDARGSGGGGPGVEGLRAGAGAEAEASMWSVRMAGHGAVPTWPLHDWRVGVLDQVGRAAAATASARLCAPRGYVTGAYAPTMTRPSCSVLLVLPALINGAVYCVSCSALCE